MKKISKGALWGIVIAAVAVVVTIVLIVVEAASGGHLYINNKTDKKITNFDVSFYDDYTDTMAGYLCSTEIAAGDKINVKYGDAFDFTGKSVSCVMKVTLEGGEEIEIVEGEFTSKFDGNFEFNFTMDEEDYYLKAKAYAGLFGSTRGSNLNDEYVLWYEDGDYDYANGDYYEDFEDDDDEY